MWYTNTAWVSNLLLRLTLGVCMIFSGTSMYREFSAFKITVTEGLGFMSFHGMAWAYILPGLLIVSGTLLAYGKAMHITAWIGGVALGSVPIGLLTKTLLTATPLPDMLNALFPYFIWLLLFVYAVNMPPKPDVEEEEEKG